MFEFDNLKFQLRIGRSFNPLTTQVEIRLYTEQQKDLIFHLSFWASLCSWHLDEILQFKNAGISRFKFTLILDLTDFPNLNYPAYQKKNAHSLLNLNKCKFESWIPSCLENLISHCFLSSLYWFGTVGILRPKGNACKLWWSWST